MQLKRFNEDFERESILPNSVPNYSYISADYKQVSDVCFELLLLLIQNGKFVYTSPTSLGSDQYSLYIFDEDLSSLEQFLHAESMNENYYDSPSEFWERWSMSDFQGEQFELSNLKITQDDIQ